MVEQVVRDRALERALPVRTLTVGDISMVIAVRLHDGNPWVMRRLELLGAHYRARPEVVLVDFGSRQEHATKLASCASRHGFEYVFEEDYGVFSLARARNLGARRAQGTLLFFSDVDCIGEADLFEQLVKLANALKMSRDVDQMINLPVYHLGADATERIEGEADPDTRSALLLECFAESAYEGFGGDVEIVDPCSNFFLCHARFFELVGGYNETFRGHGSEDFEFMLRFAMHAQTLPLPEAPLRNVYRPRREGAFGLKRYRGFRRLGEAMALQAETAGLRIAHLHHPRQGHSDDWYTSGDTDRSKLREQVQPLLRGTATLCEYDWLPRARKVAALICGKEDWALLLPLRLRGYAIEVVDVGETLEPSALLERISGSGVDSVAYVAPSVRAHPSGSQLELLLERAGHEVISVLPAAAPGEWEFRRRSRATFEAQTSGARGDVAIFRKADCAVPGAMHFPLCVKLPWAEAESAWIHRSALRRADVYHSYAASKLAMGAQRHGKSVDDGDDQRRAAAEVRAGGPEGAGASAPAPSGGGIEEEPGRAAAESARRRVGLGWMDLLRRVVARRRRG